MSHRDYRHPGSVFVRQFPRLIEVVSPGGSPHGITADNVLDQQLPRNRRIAETFARCGLVERSGQGVDRIVVQCVRQGKPLPDFSASDAHRVALTLNGEIGDEAFLKFMERVGDDALDALDSHDFEALSQIAAGVRPGTELSRQIQKLVEAGLVDRTGHGKPVLAKRYYGPPPRRSAKVAEREAIRERHKRAVSDHIAAHDGPSWCSARSSSANVSRSGSKPGLLESSGPCRHDAAGGLSRSVAGHRRVRCVARRLPHFPLPFSTAAVAGRLAPRLT